MLDQEFENFDFERTVHMQDRVLTLDDVTTIVDVGLAGNPVLCQDWGNLHAAMGLDHTKVNIRRSKLLIGVLNHSDLFREMCTDWITNETTNATLSNLYKILEFKVHNKMAAQKRLAAFKPKDSMDLC